MTNIQSAELQANTNPFLYSSIQINTAIDDKGDAWFVAKEVFEALEISWKGSFSIKKVPETWQALRSLRTPSGTQDTIFINEPAVYMVAFRSNKPEAVKFTQWVCEEVLPAVRRQGFYGSVNLKEQNTLRNQKIKLLQLLADTKDAFMHNSLITSLRNVSNLLGEPMPNTELIGKDVRQLPLGV